MLVNRSQIEFSRRKTVEKEMERVKSRKRERGLGLEREYMERAGKKEKRR